MSKRGDPRLIELFRNPSSGVGSRRLRLLGFPFDEGTVRNGGRAGAAAGAAAVRERLLSFGSAINPEFNIDLAATGVVLEDGGDAEGSTLEEAHEHMQDLVAKAIAEGSLPICIGGSNDQSYSNARGWMRAREEAKGGVVINVDAHLDVRPPLTDKDESTAPQIHSGSPFRMIFDDPHPGFHGKLIEFAAQGAQCSATHAEFVYEKGGEIYWLSQLQSRAAPGIGTSFGQLMEREQGRPTFLSFDIDSIRASDCPGVSCPSVIGLTAQDALDIMYSAGGNPDIKIVDISEFNPLIESDRTARLVAHMLYYFVLGASSRE
jgi:formiminoglutamase